MAVLDKYNDDWNIEEHSFSFEPSWFAGAIVDAPLVHKAFPVYEYHAEVLKQCHASLRVGAEIPAAATSLAAVDYMAGFYAGRKSTGGDYRAYLEKFFPSAYLPLINPIYIQLRCGLLHNLVAVNPWEPSWGHFLIVGDAGNHLHRDGTQVVWSVRTFLEHTHRASLMYAHHLIMDAPDNVQAVEKFHRRYDRLRGIGAFMAKAPDPPQQSGTATS